MTITGADYRLVGTSEDNRLGPFIRRRDLSVLTRHWIYCLVSCDTACLLIPRTVGPLCSCAECINIPSLLILIKAISEVEETVGRTWVLSSRDALSAVPFWTAASNASRSGSFWRFPLSRWICDGGGKVYGFVVFISWHCRRAQNTSHQAPFPKM